MLLGVGIGVAVTVVYLTNRSIVPPILNMVGAMGQLAGGDHSVAIPATDKKDEIGAMARAVQVFKENMIKARDLAAQEADQIKQREARARRMEELTREVRCAGHPGARGRNVRLDRAAGGGLTQMAGTAEEASLPSHGGCRRLRAGVEQRHHGRDGGGGAERSSIAEITRQVAQSAQIAGNAVAEFDRTTATVKTWPRAPPRSARSSS